MTGGDILEITWNNPNQGSGVCFAKAAEDGTFNLGGVRANDDMNGIAGSGEVITTLNRQRWSIDTTIAWDMQVAGTLEKLSALAGDPAETDFTISIINGAIYSGKGRPVGDLAGSSNTSTFPLKLSGGGILQKQ